MMNGHHDASHISRGSTEGQERKAPWTEPPVRKEARSLDGITPDFRLRYRLRAAWLVGFYVPLLILPWSFTCVMMFRPIMKSSYINQIGQYSMADIYHMERWYTATAVLNSISSVLAVPACSTLLALGAVIYTQRRKSGPDLNIRQMFTLADRGWMSIPLLWLALWKPSQNGSSRYLWYGAFLMLVGKYVYHIFSNALPSYTY